jgi:Na+/H+-translocating membrane pyrophosphatase
MGMKIATKANIRTTVSCEGPDGLNNGLQVAFRSGAVMALSVRTAFCLFLFVLLLFCSCT